MDNIDGDVISTLEYKIEFGKDGVYTPMSATNTECAISTTNDCFVKYAVAKKIIDTTRVCQHKDNAFDAAGENNDCVTTPECHYKVTLRANDYAEIYGHNGEDNVRTHAVHLIVRDTRKPVIQVQGADPMQVECNSAETSYTYGEKNSDGNYNAVTSYNAGSAACKANGAHDFCANGADVLDLQDTVAFKRDIEYKVQYSGTSTQGKHNAAGSTTSTFTKRSAPLPINKVGAYKVHFNAKDHSCNDADEVTREVAVIDTTKPVVALVGKQTVFIEDGSSKDKKIDGELSWNQLETHSSGVTCSDMCSLNDVKITSHWSPSPWEPKTTGTASGKGFGPGTYVQTYRCFDHEGNSAEIARTYVVEDNGLPIIKLNGKSSVTLEASKDAEYTDEGATCSDFSDGQIDHQVVIHGDVVNYRVPGTYIIRFDCEDSSGNDADRRERTVVVEDTDCPYVKLFGESTTSVEAGFPYEDLHATATDTLDGDVTADIVNTGGPAVSHFNYETSCKAIKGVSTSAKSGNYNILVTIDGKHNFLPVYCDMTTETTLFIHKGHKLFHSDISESEQIVPYGSNQGACGSYGLKMASFATAAAENAAVLYAKNLEGGSCPDCIQGATQVATTGWKFSKTEKTTDYFCMPKEDKSGGAEKYTAAERKAINDDAENSIASTPGTFVMVYRVKDRAGNGWGTSGCNGDAACCARAETKRTINVIDTLPPVITLRLKNKLVQKSFGAQRGINHVSNPAGFASDDSHLHAAGRGFGHHANLVKGNPFLSVAEHKDGNPNDFMAEQTTAVNGWIIGAVASAVAGVALLGYSMKSTPTTVPV